MEENESRSDERSLARRRLIRGVFSAPVALTLHSGSAIAGSSNALRALANLAGGTQPNPILEAGQPSDTWIRLPELSVVHESDEDPVKVVFGGDLQVYYDPDKMTTFLDSQQYARVFDSSVYPVPATATLVPTGRHVTVRFDPLTGNIIGVAEGAGTAATCSALTTFSNVCGF